MEYTFPNALLEHFLAEALKSTDLSGETVALAIGHKTKNVLNINQLIFPAGLKPSDATEQSGKVLDKLQHNSDYLHFHSMHFRN